MFNLRKAVTGTARAEPEGPQRDLLPLPSLLASRLRLLQTFYRPIL